MVIYVPERQRVNITLYSSKVFLCRMKFQSHWNKVDFTIQILVKRNAKYLFTRMKREWHMNLKTVNTKHLKMDFKNYQNVAHLFTEVLIIS